MESLIEKFLSVSYGYGSGDGSGSGSGYGYGSGSGDGSGYSDGSGSGSGYGDGSGDGSGSGSGSGSGYGSGHGSGYGSCSGSGSGDGIKSINGQLIYIIDSTPTIIESVVSNYAKGFVLLDDLNLKPCYIAKVGNYFAHGYTLKRAFKDASAKYSENLPLEDRINLFLEHFEIDKTYLALEFFKWHNALTGSCEFGRRNFCKERGIDIDKDYLTITDFIRLTEDSYGANVIKLLKEKLTQ